MSNDCDLFRHAMIQQQKQEDAEKICDKKILSWEDQYCIWKRQKGARHVLKHFYAITSSYVAEWQKTGLPVSNALIFELIRHKIKHRLNRAERLDIKLSKWEGYTLNNNFRAYIARDVMEHKPEWKGIFEIRELR